MFMRNIAETVKHILRPIRYAISVSHTALEVVKRKGDRASKLLHQESVLHVSQNVQLELLTLLLTASVV
jgi:hypothetical protein